MDYQDAVLEQMKRAVSNISEFAPSVIIFVSYVESSGMGRQLSISIGDGASHYGMVKEYISIRDRHMGGGENQRVDL